MYSHILIATDGSDLAAKGQAQGLALAKALGARVTVLTASEPWTPLGVDATGMAVSEYTLGTEFEKAAADAGRTLLDAAAKAAAAAGVACETVYVPRQHPADAIVEYAEGHGVDLIVMASHGRRGIGRLLLGSQTTEVLTRGTVPVLVVR